MLNNIHLNFIAKNCSAKNVSRQGLTAGRALLLARRSYIPLYISREPFYRPNKFRTTLPPRINKCVQCLFLPRKNFALRSVSREYRYRYTKVTRKIRCIDNAFTRTPVLGLIKKRVNCNFYMAKLSALSHYVPPTTIGQHARLTLPFKVPAIAE